MTIRSVDLEEFQSHKSTHLELSDGLNIIYGSSDNGKSSIIRGIRWAVLNRPNGDDFRRHETKKTSVTLELDNFIVERRRTDSKNEYEVDKKIYKALRTTVPEDISRILNLSEANIQSQYEIYFLVDKSPGQRSKVLNEVAGLQIMDKVLKKTNSESRSINSDIKATNKQLVEVQNKILDLDWVEKAHIFFIKLEKLQTELEHLEEKKEYIISILEQLEKREKEKSKFLSDACIQDIYSLFEKDAAMEEYLNQYNFVMSIIDKIKKIESHLEFSTVIDLTELEKTNINIDSKQKQYKLILDITEEINFRKEQHKQLKSELVETEKEIELELKRLGLCPTCGREI